MAKKKYTFIDLFAGCGGLSEGFLQTGRFKALAHVEWEKPMVETLRHRLVEEWGESESEAKRKVILFDIQKTDELINGSWSEESNQQYGLHNANEVKTKGLKGIVGKHHVDMIDVEHGVSCISNRFLIPFFCTQLYLIALVVYSFFLKLNAHTFRLNKL